MYMYIFTLAHSQWQNKAQKKFVCTLQNNKFLSILEERGICAQSRHYAGAKGAFCQNFIRDLCFFLNMNVTGLYKTLFSPEIIPVGLH